jgi:hypothetical protein
MANSALPCIRQEWILLALKHAELAGRDELFSKKVEYGEVLFNAVV